MRFKFFTHYNEATPELSESAKSDNKLRTTALNIWHKLSTLIDKNLTDTDKEYIERTKFMKGSHEKYYYIPADKAISEEDISDQFKFIKRKGNIFYFSFDADIYGKTHPVTFVFGVQQGEEGEFSYDSQRDYIILGVCDELGKLKRKNIRELLESKYKVMHEVGHFIITKRAQNKNNLNLKAPKTDEEYYNDKEEINTHLLEILQWFNDNFIRNADKNTIKQLGKPDKIRSIINYFFIKPPKEILANPKMSYLAYYSSFFQNLRPENLNYVSKKIANHFKNRATSEKTLQELLNHHKKL